MTFIKKNKEEARVKRLSKRLTQRGEKKLEGRGYRRAYLHAAIRARQRYSTLLSHREYRCLCRKILDGKASFVCQSEAYWSRALYLIGFIDRWGIRHRLLAVYDFIGRVIVTLLPYNAYEVREINY